MKSLSRSLLRRFLKDERGQSGVVLLVMISSIMGIAGMSIETGHVYYAYRLLQASTNASALAAAYGMPAIGTSTSPSAGTAYYDLYEYSVQSGEENATRLLTNASITANYYCSSSTSGTLQVGCMIPTSGSCSGSASACNAVTATQTATIPLWFGGLIGFQSLTVKAQATAAMAGGVNTPWNIAVIMDTTASMNDSDSGSIQCKGTQIVCALQGYEALLQDLYPCSLGQTCTGSSGVTPVDSVALYAFPGLVNTTANINKDTVCNTSNPSTVSYTIPNTSPAYTPGTAPASNLMLPTGSSGDTYQVVPFSNNFKTVDTNSGLYQSSALAITAGDSGVSGCQGLQAPGGKATYYAQVIYQAQEDLAALNRPGSKNAIILLSDGDATACAANANTTYGACSTASDITATEGTLNGTCTSSHSCTNSNATTVTYPSALGECGQAVLAAQYAANQGTSVYVIAYGSETSGGCLSDKTYSATVTTNGGSWAPGDQPCAAMEAMASDPANFYSDDGQGCKATDPNSSSLTQLTAIFRAITNNMTVPRLIPNGT
jgi:putative Tad-like protein involved in Flp pilus assembly